MGFRVIRGQYRAICHIGHIRGHIITCRSTFVYVYVMSVLRSTGRRQRRRRGGGVASFRPYSARSHWGCLGQSATWGQVHMRTQLTRQVSHRDIYSLFTGQSFVRLVLTPHTENGLHMWVRRTR